MIPVIPPAEVEVDSDRRYIAANDAACELLGYTRQELLGMHIDDVSFPSGAHVDPMYTRFVENGVMEGIFALQRKSGEVLRVRFQAKTAEGRSIATWTHYELWNTQPSTDGVPAAGDQPLRISPGSATPDSGGSSSSAATPRLPRSRS